MEMTCTMRDWKPYNQYNNLNGGSISTFAKNSDSKEPEGDSMIAGCQNDPELMLSPICVVDRPQHLMNEHLRSFNSEGSREKPRNDSGSGSRNSSRSRSGSRLMVYRDVSGCRSNSISRRRRWSDLYCDEQRQEQERKKEKVILPFSVPISDILVVDTSRNYAPIYLTTTNMGYFEFTFSTQNSHDVLLAFLTNSLPSERVTCDILNTVTFDDSTATFDVEALTARRLRETVKSETFRERVRRKMTFFAGRFSDFSTTFAECCACDCYGDFEHPLSPEEHQIRLKSRSSKQFHYGDDCFRERPPYARYYVVCANNNAISTPHESKQNDADLIDYDHIKEMECPHEMELETTSCMSYSNFTAN